MRVHLTLNLGFWILHVTEHFYFYFLHCKPLPPLHDFPLISLPGNHIFRKQCCYPTVAQWGDECLSPPRPCFSSSHYQSVELISLVAVGAILGLTSLISKSYFLLFLVERTVYSVDLGQSCCGLFFLPLPLPFF